MTYIPLVNVDIPMPEEMLQALTRLEARYVSHETISQDDVLSFLKEFDLEDKFQENYLFRPIKD